MTNCLVRPHERLGASSPPVQEPPLHNPPGPIQQTKQIGITSFAGGTTSPEGYALRLVAEGTWSKGGRLAPPIRIMPAYREAHIVDVTAGWRFVGITYRIAH